MEILDEVRLDFDRDAVKVERLSWITIKSHEPRLAPTCLDRAALGTGCSNCYLSCDERAFRKRAVCTIIATSAMSRNVHGLPSTSMIAA